MTGSVVNRDAADCERNQRNAVVTGASSGIGEVYARMLAQRGYDLLLVARRTARLAELQVDLAGRYGVEVEISSADLADLDEIGRVARQITSRESLSLLVNNAGFGTLGDFADVRLDRHRDMIHVHVMAVMELTYAVLRVMLANGHGNIVNVSSMSAFLVGPGQVTYAATKSFIKSFSESLQAELRGTEVGIQVLCPGMTRTGFHDTPDFAGFDRGQITEGLWMDAEDVVAASLRGLGRRVSVCVPGLRNKVLTRLFGIGPIRGWQYGAKETRIGTT